jgi:hypothetical protein
VDLMAVEGQLVRCLSVGCKKKDHDGHLDRAALLIL